MLSLRKHFGTAGLLVAVVALVAALGGSAIAANGGGSGDATASAKRGGNVNKLIKRESRKFSKRFSAAFSKRFAIPGPIGPQGVPGLPGPEGPKGDDGDDGDDGSNGTNGKSVEVTELAAGECANEEGGAEVKEEGAVAGVEVCNGEEGSPWTAGGTLPSESTLTGGWTVSTTQEASPDFLGFSDTGHTTLAPISFPIPLSNVVPLANAIFVPEGNTSTEHCSAAPIGGTLENPKAEAGYLCVYSGELVNLAPETVSGSVSAANPFIPLNVDNFGARGADVSGTSLALSVKAAGDALGWGSWAVTG